MNHESLARSRFALWLAETVPAMIILSRVDDASLEPMGAIQPATTAGRGSFAAGFIFLA